jgi:hypothetical protein
MADQYTTASPSGSYSTTRHAEPDGHGMGWVIFAGTMLAIIGILNFIYGIAAISNSKFYTHDATYVISGLKTWGWVLMIIGIVQFLAALSIWGGTEWGRWVGIASAGINAIVQLIFIAGYPFLSLAIFAVDVLIIYGLAAYGGQHRPA